MKKIILVDLKRIADPPDRVITLLSSGNFSQDGVIIKTVELRLYIEKIDKKLGPYSLITSYVETDKGSAEMIYDEGFHGQDSIERASNFLESTLGLSALILRSIIALTAENTNP